MSNDYAQLRKRLLDQIEETERRLDDLYSRLDELDERYLNDVEGHGVMTPRSDPLSRLSDRVAELALRDTCAFAKQTARMWAERERDMAELIADLKRQNGEKP
jgi:DNA repair exonuclease SbcCD ATPase subunit